MYLTDRNLYRRRTILVGVWIGSLIQKRFDKCWPVCFLGHPARSRTDQQTFVQ